LKIANETIFWRFRNRKCPGYLQRINDEELIEIRKHNHLGCTSTTNAIYAKFKLNEYAENNNEQPYKIITNILKDCDDNTVKKLPCVKGLKDAITRKRNKIRGGVDFIYDDIPKTLQCTLSGKRFLLYDSGVLNEERIIIFASDKSIDYLKKSKVWLSDGTFKSCPSSFYQLYVIHGYLFGITIPLVYILMSNKTQRSYELIFEKLKALNCFPKQIVVDFEQSAISAYKKIFDASKMNGCIFHLSQSVWRNISKSGYTALYKNNLNFKTSVHMLLDCVLHLKSRFLIYCL
jgi:hypothetical protein